jgi:hypothetical protein|tara:strand:- start:753 stop:3065 length:2313 start_codon:yes stop_codon:yes gene_type:complete
MSAKQNPSLPQKKESSKGHKYRLVNLSSPKAIDFEFLREAAKGIRPFQYDLTSQASNSEPRLISNRAMGVGVAVPNDSAACSKVLELIKELGVETVRLDLTYTHDLTRADELVDGLYAMNIGVLLHLIQPLSEAEKMPTPEALNSWIDFVQKSLDHFSNRIEAVEIGSTINRAKWTRYSLEGFLAAWESAYKEVKARKLTLVGPNVTDFEPTYNAGLLGMLKRRTVLPDINSNNLFAERATEPENVDQKILGQKLKNLHGYDLKKKIRLLGAIAGRNGISRNWSTSAFWTLPRIERYLDFSEELMADYLARYFTICFSDPSFERIYWGPLISSREGLLDDGTGIIPKSSELDIVALHDHIPGSPESWRIRPAFHTFKTINSFIGGAQYQGTRCAKEGLEIHEFSKDGKIIHIGWTKNAKLARLRDCYSSNDLDTLSSVYTRNGDLDEERPDFLSQSPAIFIWEENSPPKVSETAGVVPNLVAAPSADGHRYYDFHTTDWRGVIRAHSRDEAEILATHLGPEAISNKDEQGSLRKARNAVWKVTDPRDPNRFLVVKKPRRLAINKKILDRNKPSKALRSWNGTSELMRRNIETPQTVAYFESTDPKDMMSNWFICDHVSGELSVKYFFAGYSAGDPDVKGVTFDEFSDQMVDFIYLLHSRGCCFRDLSGGNLLVKSTEKSTENQGLQFSLIDTARMRCRLKGLPLSLRISDLKRLILKLAPPLQEVFMNKYMKQTGKKFTFSHRLSLKLYALKTDFKRQKRNFRKKTKKPS